MDQIEDVPKKGWQWIHIGRLKGNKMLLNRKDIACEYVCKICLAKKPSSIKDALIALHKNNVSNATSHLKQHQIYSPSSPPGKVDKKTAYQPAVYLSSGNDQALVAVSNMLVRYVVNNRLPLAAAHNPDLIKLIHLASNLRPNSFVPMTRGKMNTKVIGYFGWFVTAISKLLSRAKSQYNCSDGGTAEGEGWLIVGHDGWDSIVKQFFGVSFFSKMNNIEFF